MHFLLPYILPKELLHKLLCPSPPSSQKADDVSSTTAAPEEEEEETDNIDSAPYLSYWHPNFTISLVYDDMKLSPSSLPPQIIERMSTRVLNTVIPYIPQSIIA